ncbi:hypothetical protein [Hoeflea sp.]|jgi:hypothetical protein|uniref:hypothetical protein n=1 Tax=Hoeflea sp. TaxID=1940281 RepID=UPI003A944640
MPGDEIIDQCPFCNAPWGVCGHALLLAEWEADALARELQASGEQPRARAVGDSDKMVKPTNAIGTGQAR